MIERWISGLGFKIQNLGLDLQFRVQALRIQGFKDFEGFKEYEGFKSFENFKIKNLKFRV